MIQPRRKQISYPSWWAVCQMLLVKELHISHFVPVKRSLMACSWSAYRIGCSAAVLGRVKYRTSFFHSASKVIHIAHLAILSVAHIFTATFQLFWNSGAPRVDDVEAIAMACYEQNLQRFPAKPKDVQLVILHTYPKEPCTRNFSPGSQSLGTPVLKARPQPNPKQISLVFSHLSQTRFRACVAHIFLALLCDLSTIEGWRDVSYLNAYITAEESGGVEESR